MLANVNLLINILNLAIERLADNITTLRDEKSQSLDEFQKVAELLREDYNNIVKVDLETIADLLSLLNLSDEEREQEYNSLHTIKTLLELNKLKHTTFKLNPKQIDLLESIPKNVRKLEKMREHDEEVRGEQIVELTKKINKYNALLKMLANSNNIDFVNNVDLLEDLFLEENVSEDDRRTILLSIMRYNKDVYQKRVQNLEEAHIEVLDLEKVKQLFSTYGYDFLSLSNEAQENILEYANLKNMEEVFSCLKELNYPKINIKREENKLIYLLINSNKVTIEENTLYSKSKGISPSNLLSLLPAILPQVKKDDGRRDASNKIPYIVGRCVDYRENVEFLERLGLDIQFIYNKCREILIMPHNKLVSNYEKFASYGFTFASGQFGELTHPALSCLVSCNFEDIVDQFIEICPNGYQYIKENSSRITSFSSPDDLVFYNIYASYMSEDNLGNKLYPEGPFVNFQNNKKKNLNLRGEITRYVGSGYENIPYRGVTDDNKHEKTMTIEKPFTYESSFLSAIERAKSEDIPELEDDSKILMLDEYNDPYNKYRYNINGCLISKLKVRRIYNILKYYGYADFEDSLLFAITYNTIISDEDFNKIKSAIRERSK